jgi:hypothetical protein
MHIEKNVCENILFTLLNVPRKTKDTHNARLDLFDMGIRHQASFALTGEREQLS